MTAQGYQHEAVFYAGEDAFVAATLPFLHEALDNGEPTLVALPGDHLTTLRDALGAHNGDVSFVDMATIGRNPACIIAAWVDFVDAHRRHGTRVRGLGEPIYLTRSSAEIDECHRHEALLNVAFDNDVPFWLRCPYDALALDPHVLAQAHRSHPMVRHDTHTTRSNHYDHAGVTSTVFADAPPAPPTGAKRLPLDMRQPSDVRRAAVAHARTLGVRDDADALSLVLSELATNAIRHGDGCGELYMWRDEDRIVCQTRNRGSLREPLTGRLRPAPQRADGRGLWIVSQLCDLVQIRSDDAGTVVITAHLPTRRPTARAS